MVDLSIVVLTFARADLGLFKVFFPQWKTHHLESIVIFFLCLGPSKQIQDYGFMVYVLWSILIFVYNLCQGIMVYNRQYQGI